MRKQFNFKLYNIKNQKISFVFFFIEIFNSVFMDCLSCLSTMIIFDLLGA